MLGQVDKNYSYHLSHCEGELVMQHVRWPLRRHRVGVGARAMVWCDGEIRAERVEVSIANTSLTTGLIPRVQATCADLAMETVLVYKLPDACDNCPQNPSNSSSVPEQS